MEVIKVKIGDVKPYWRNPRNNEGAVEAVKESIRRYGFNSPIVLDSENVIIAGHTRYKALMELGYEEVECVIADITPEKAKEYRIADNKTAEFATWDYDKLIPELRGIKDASEFQVFFQSVSLDELLRETSGAGDSSFKDHTQEEIDKRQDELNTQFQEAATRTEYVEMTCPHCGESYYVDRAEVNRQPTVAHD